ncbi:MAG TPA: hypothetical protein VEX68_13575, partial [Bryobacteraceae bacterium]|nr:hypothetical protein [Bryobacteraceae bacterium]
PSPSVDVITPEPSAPTTPPTRSSASYSAIASSAKLSYNPPQARSYQANPRNRNLRRLIHLSANHFPPKSQQT